MKQAIFYFFILILSINFQSCQSKKNLLFQNTSKKGVMDLSKKEAAAKGQNILFNSDLLRLNDTVSADFFSDEIQIVITGLNETENARAWEGKVLNEESSYVLFSEVKDAIIGNINLRGILYQVRSVGEGVHQLIKVDQTKFPQEGESIVPDLEGQVPILKDCPNTDPPTNIDVMVVYTQAAETGAGSQANMVAEIYLAVQETNFSYQQSGITQRLNLVHIDKISYTETGNMNTDLPWLRTDPGVVTKRNSYSADAVVMIVENGGGYCGLGYFMQTVSPTFDDFAFSVVKRSCATGYYSFGHELGHNMGANHDCGQTTNNQPYVYAHGFNHCGTNKYRTVMAYNSCSEPRVPRWSNPGITFNGIAMGTNSGTCQACNACTLNNTALTVANFRCSSGGAGNVWMKDTWNDTGAEPNPNTAGEPMWISPSIWVRNQQDNLFLHQHQHQNPEFGQSNWVYVKLQNGGPAQTGNLELWYANASLSLSWPGSWVPLASIPVSVPANSSMIVDQLWASLPASSGHYCMIARWVSATDPMHSAETTDINFNTLENNNIVWRNMNIVNMAPDELVIAKAKFKILPRTQISFVQEASPLDGATFTEAGGKITFKFDEKTADIFSDNDLQFENLRKVDDGRWALLQINNSSVQLPNYNENYEGEIELFFEIGEAETLADYILHVKHRSGEREIGGVSYLITTRKD